MKRYTKLFEQFVEESLKYKLHEILDSVPDIPFVYFAVVDGQVRDFVISEWATDNILKNSIMDIHGEELEEKWREEMTEMGENYEEFMFDPMLDDIMQYDIDATLIQVDMKTGEIIDYYKEEELEDNNLIDQIFELFGEKIVTRWKKASRGRRMFGV